MIYSISDVRWVLKGVGDQGVVHGIQTGWEAIRPNEMLLKLGIDKDAAVKEGAAGGGMGILPTTEMAEAAGAMIASSVSRK